METLIQDLRYAVRSLRRSPGFVVVAVLTLAVGVGANTAIFSAVEAVLLRPLPYKNPDRVVFIQEKRAVTGQPNSVSPLNYLDWKTQSTAFDKMAAVRFDPATITALDTPVQVRGLRVTERVLRRLWLAAAARPHLRRRRRSAGRLEGGHPEPAIYGRRGSDRTRRSSGGPCASTVSPSRSSA